MTFAEIDHSIQVFNLHCGALVLMSDGWPLNHCHPRPPAECTPPAEWALQTANHKDLTRDLLDSSERVTPVSKSSGRNRILPATREYQNHVEKTCTCVKQKVHGEVNRQQVFHIFWNTNLCCDKRSKATASRPRGQRQIPKVHAPEKKKQALHQDCHDGWAKRDKQRTVPSVA